MRGIFYYFYAMLARGLHLTPETEEELDRRLNADEEAFAQLAAH